VKSWLVVDHRIGPQRPHQLDVAPWALGNPSKLPARVMSFGNRWGYDDDGQTANNQMALYDYGKGNVPILFDNRGLPAKDMNWQATAMRMTALPISTRKHSATTSSVASTCWKISAVTRSSDTARRAFLSAAPTCGRSTPC